MIRDLESKLVVNRVSSFKVVKTAETMFCSIQILTVLLEYLTVNSIRV